MNSKKQETIISFVKAEKRIERTQQMGHIDRFDSTQSKRKEWTMAELILQHSKNVGLCMKQTKEEWTARTNYHVFSEAEKKEQKTQL